MTDQALRQSTETIVRMGGYYDVTDGVTPETGITLGAADQAEVLKAAGAATVDISGNTWAAITGCDGFYNLTLSASNLDTTGTLEVVVADASVFRPILPARFQVLAADAYDALYSSTSAPATLEQVQGACEDAIAAAPEITGIATDLGDVSTAVDGIAADLPVRLTKNTAFANFPFYMVQSANPLLPATGLSVACTRRIDSGVFASCTTATATEISNGWYSINLSADDLNGDSIALKFTATGAVQTGATIITQTTT